MPIRPPRHDLRPGALALATARLVILALLCALQYWLLTTTMEAFHGGDRRLPLAAAIASLACFVLGLGLVVAAERQEARRRQRRERDERGGDS
jgi:hypothetical protein